MTVHEGAMPPFVTVVIPSYNYAHMLPCAIESVLAQTFSDLEIIIVDDGSTDDTVETVKRFQADARVHYLYQENKGLAAARNTGINNARGSYVAFIDPDDLWKPDKLARQVPLVEGDPDVGLVYCQVSFIDNEGVTLPDVSWPRPPEKGLKELLYVNWVEGSGSSVLIRKMAFDNVGLFDSSLKGLEDLNMWLRILHDWKAACVEEPLVLIRRHGKSMQSGKMTSNLKKREQELLRHVNRAIELFPELEPFRSLAYHELYAGLAYTCYVYRRFSWSIRYLLYATKYRPTFLITAAGIYLKKYFLRKKRFG